MPTTLFSAEMPTSPFKYYGGDIMEVVGSDIISKRRERRKYLPLEIRMKMYENVVKLRKQELKYKEIQKIIYEKYGKRISLSRISDWINGKRHPLGNVNKFDGKPSPELECVVGVMFSDGYKYFNDGKYRLRLAVVDREYAEEFGKNLAKLLGRKEPYKPFYNEKLKRWVVVGSSFQLYKFLDRPFEELKQYVEHCKDCVSAFLRALFDGDGHIYKRRLMLYNTNKELLIYVQYLLKKYFDIDATGPYLTKKKGSIARFPNGKIVKTNEDCYYIYIRARSLLNFYKYIGFTIKRKQQRLVKAISSPFFLVHIMLILK
jgi:intein-encoded DNA endonuclease-like protein